MKLAVDVLVIWLVSGVGLLAVGRLMGLSFVPAASAKPASVPACSTPGPRYCSECGAPNPADASYCVACGKSLG